MKEIESWAFYPSRISNLRADIDRKSCKIKLTSASKANFVHDQRLVCVAETVFNCVTYEPCRHQKRPKKY